MNSCVVLIVNFIVCARTHNCFFARHRRWANFPPPKRIRQMKVDGMGTQQKLRSNAMGNMDPNKSDVDRPPAVADHSNDRGDVDLPVADHSHNVRNSNGGRGVDLPDSIDHSQHNDVRNRNSSANTGFRCILVDGPMA
jgi:hypothetical protein